PADAVVMSWRGAQGAIDAARGGHDVVLSPSPQLYLDHLQSDAPDEPPGRPDVVGLADVYAFTVVPPALEADAARHVLGAQANLWTEHMRTPERVEHAAFPRLAALAEVLWTPPARRGWQGFVARLGPQMDRYRALGVDAADSAFEVRFGEDADAGAVTVTLSDQAGLPIRYTRDGREPTAASPLYSAPLRLERPATLRAAAFLGTRALGARRRDYAADEIARRSSDALKQCSGKLTLRLEDDAPGDDGRRARFDVDLFDPCWIWPQAPLAHASRLAARVGQLPYNFQLGKDAANVVPRPPPASADGELIVRLDTCSGPTLVALPLAAAAASRGTTTLAADLPRQDGPHDLCFVFSGRGSDPLWAIDDVRLLPR
ncbi:MAG TPA: family 20 glycosylhydrolase, partial [Dokdonella sp.]